MKATVTYIYIDSYDQNIVFIYHIVLQRYLFTHSLWNIRGSSNKEWDFLHGMKTCVCI